MTVENYTCDHVDIIIIMPKYVAKEDVEKGLVDPKVSLDEQPDYKKKIEQEHVEKEKHHDQRPQRQRPKKERPPRKERPTFNWNKNDITLQTKAPEKPKKVIEKPDAQKHKEGFQKLKAERESLKTQRQALIEEQRVIIRDINESKKNGRQANTQYSGALRQKMNVENQIRKEIRAIDDDKKKIYAEIDHLKSDVQELRRPSNSQGLSLQTLQTRIAEKEHLLMTSNINKKQQAKLTNEINELKRALHSARPSIEIESQVNKLNDQIQILLKELKPIKHELHVRITRANQIKEEINILKQEYTIEKGAVVEKKSVEDIKAEYDVKLKAIQDKRDKLEERIDDYMDKHTRAIDDYEDQQDLLRYIKWVEDQVQRLKQWEKEKALREKKKAEQEKKRQKEKEQYQKRQQERKRREEERKKNQEDRKLRLEKQKEDFLNRNPNHQTIDLCHSLIDYCQSLKPISVYQHEEQRNKAPGEIKFGKEWQKQIKGGAQVIVSKKNNIQEQVKKPQKQKAKPEKAEEENFEHGIEVINQFQVIKLLPPNKAAEIESTIKLIKDKIDFYNNPTEEEKAAFRQKSLKEWQERNDPRERRQGNFKEKREEDGEAVPQPRKDKKDYNKKGKKAEITEGDFPELA